MSGIGNQAFSTQPWLVPRLTAEELTAHAEFLASLGENAIWRDYLTTSPKMGLVAVPDLVAPRAFAG